MIKINKGKLKISGKTNDVMAELACVITICLEKFGVNMTNLAIEIGNENYKENKCIKNQIKRFKTTKTC